MGRLEEQIRPILTPLILGEPGVLTSENQKLLAQWIALKVMVTEQNQPDEVVFTAVNRETFMLDQTIPVKVSISIARCFSTQWRSQFLRCSAHLSAVTSLPPTVMPPADAGKNVQTTALGFGELFAYVIVSKSDTLDLYELINDNWKIGEYLMQIFPFSSDPIALPMRYIVAEKIANGISTALNRIVSDDAIRHYEDYFQQ